MKKGILETSLKPLVERSRNHRKVPSVKLEQQEPSGGFDSAQPAVWGKAVLNFLFVIFLLLISSESFAAQKIQEVNYYSSFRAAETNVRAGPGQNYPIKFTYRIKGVPVRVISEYDNWNEVEDYEKQTGWISQSLLTKKRTAMVQINKDFINMHVKPSEKSRVLFHLENFVIADFLGCQDDWCNIKIQGKKGWVKKATIFGAGEEGDKSGKS